MAEDVFVEEWRECLRAHYRYVIRTNDHITEPSLRVVMQQAGFDDSELAELRVLATMHIDDSGPDFVPDMDVLETPAVPTEAKQVFPSAAPPAAAEETALPPVDAEDATLIEVDVEDSYLIGEEILIEDAALDDIPPEEAAMPQEEQDNDPDEPAQLSLF